MWLARSCSAASISCNASIAFSTALRGITSSCVAAAAAAQDQRSTLAEAAASSASEASTSRTSRLLIGAPSSELTPDDVGLYYQLNAGRVPEAFPALFQTFYAQRSKPRVGGCVGLQDEAAFVARTAVNPPKPMGRSSSGSDASASGSGSKGPLAVMYREAMHGLFSAVSPAPRFDATPGASSSGSGSGARMLLQGPEGSGKSVALLSLVERARANGWLVMYIPSATAFIRGGYFFKREGAGVYDTILSAQHVLKGMAEAHGQQLGALQQTRSLQGWRAVWKQERLAKQGDAASKKALAAVAAEVKAAAAPQGSLLDLVNQGLSTDMDGALAVDSLLALRDELAAAATSRAVPHVLFAIDDYNVLYGATDYGRLVGPALQARRRLLKIEELTLASGMRLLEAAPEKLGAAHVVCAMSASKGVSEKTEIPVAAGSTNFHVPRYSQIELAHALTWYHECGVLRFPPTQLQVDTLLALTNGNGREVRQLAAKSRLVHIPNPDVVQLLA